jgi:predicted nucleotidyltransferase
VVLVDLLIRVAEELDKARLQFVLFGGMAVSAWMRERLTRDCDIVVRAGKRDVARLKQALIAAGAHVTALEMRWIYERRFVRLNTSSTHKLDVYVASTTHDRAAIAQAERVHYGGRTVRVARPEDLILYKLKAWRGQDQVDIAQLLRALKRIDRDYIESWLDDLARRTGAPMRDRWKQSLENAAREEEER